VTFTAPASNGGSAITGYTVTSNPAGGVDSNAGSTGLSHVITGLTNGTAYTFTVKATNAVGTGAASAASNSVTPATIPGAPTIGTATGGNAQATVTFTAPASNGGSAITGYTVTSNPAGGVDSNAGSTGLSHVITGLTNGTAYTFTVKATNAIGTGTASAASNSTTPASTPGAPTIGSATAGNAQATVSFTAPTSNGGSAITGYTVTSSPAGGVDSNAGSTGLSHIITGLTNGTAYTFTVKATNAVGTGAASAASNSVTPLAASQTISFGTAPTLAYGGTTTVSATATSGLAVAFTSITPTVCTVSGSTVTAVAAGTCTIAANQSGNASYSAAPQATQNLTIAALVPGAPTIGTASRGNAQATVTFTAPASNGGSAITGYTVTSSPAGGVDSNAGSTGLSHIITGLTNGTAYTFTVKATNAIGTGAASAASNSVTPVAASQTISFGATPTLVYGGTTTVSATASSGLAVTFTSTTPTICSVSGSTVTSVTAGTCTVAANQAGNASYSAAPQATQNIIIAAVAPSAPVIGTASAGNAQATVTFTAPASNGGSAITGYTVTSSPAGGVDSNAGSTGLSHIITGLINGTAYTFTVKATNAVGTGAASAASNSVTPVAASQTISFGAAPTVVVGGTGTLNATGGLSGNAISYASSTPAICTVSGSSVTGVSVGTCIVTANQAGNANYNAAAQASQNIGVGKGSQNISFGTAPTMVVGGTGTVSATGGASGSTITFASSTPTTCTVSGATVTGVSVGACVVTANQAGNSNYLAASQVTQNIAVNATTPIANLSNPSLSFPGQAQGSSSAAQTVTLTNIGAAALSITSIVANGDFAVSNNPCGTSLAAGANCIISVIFTPTATGNRSGALAITDNASGSPHTVSLSGFGQLSAGSGAVTASLVAGWNLLGNGTTGTVDVASAFGDASQVYTVWKWLPGTAPGWAFYTPTQADGGAAYAAGKGYGFLTTVNSGEGFWVNAKQAFSVSLGSGGTLATAGFRDGSGVAGANPLATGWSLIAVGDNPTPRGFANGILDVLATPPGPGTPPAATTLTSLWAWHPGNDVQSPGWLFYAPSLDNSGGLGGYIGGKGYLDFGTMGKTLDATTGFWVNHP
ncbi:MAG: fibronectin type III domain-containing protein, partial [Rhodocyclaceae bacterium]|nr:fibronectin type III domain-containing protein [Rhodocyclaceae bacterium]